MRTTRTAQALPTNRLAHHSAAVETFRDHKRDGNCNGFKKGLVSETFAAHNTAQLECLESKRGISFAMRRLDHALALPKLWIYCYVCCM